MLCRKRAARAWSVSGSGALVAAGALPEAVSKPSRREAPRCGAEGLCGSAEAVWRPVVVQRRQRVRLIGLLMDALLTVKSRLFGGRHDLLLDVQGW